MGQSPQQLTELRKSFPTTNLSSLYPPSTSYTNPSNVKIQSQSTIKVPLYQPHNLITSTNSSHQMVETKDHLRKNLTRAEATIKELQNFGSNLENLEWKTQGLLRDQASLNFNLLNRYMKLPYSLQKATTTSSAVVAESSSSPSITTVSSTTVSLLPSSSTTTTTSPSSPSSPLKPPYTLLQKHSSVPGPLQHPYSHLKPSDFVKIFGKYKELEMEDVRDTNMESSIMPLEPENRDENEDGVSTILPEVKDQDEDKDMVPTIPPINPPEPENQDENEDISTIPAGSNTALPTSIVPSYSTPIIIIESPRHPILFTTTDNISEQIVLELSHLVIMKNDELRLIHAELAKARIMLEQLRRVHLKPFFFNKNKRGELYMKRLVVKKIKVESKEQARLREVIRRGGMALRSMTFLEDYGEDKV
ncbi:hypothetical protein DID88_009718 [Monilinia fructigena]|uniref:Uncharacterized protein n=1 Tax=Monilinia fructigena TaxID=38457 RepID=A0A395IJH5_9HELO|nr:hypothetical protein DID88_009718 [Monilinia fructigena]